MLAAAQRTDAAAGKQPDARFTFLDANVLEHNKELYDTGHKETTEAVARLVHLTDSILERPVEVVTNKAFEPPTGDKRTYVSLATYCWPANPDDLEHPRGPWECIDGRPFPARHTIAPDFLVMARLHNHAMKLGLAYYFTRERRYAERLATRVRAFYLDPETGMLPHLMYAQLKPGFDTGAATGTIDNKNIAFVFDALALIAPSGELTAADMAGMRAWATGLLRHLQSEHVKREAMQHNNHGSYFDVQYLSVLQFLGRDTDAAGYVVAAVQRRLDGQILGGWLPSELVRPKSYAYSNFLLEAYARLAMHASRLGLDLWRYNADKEASILDAWDAMSEHWCDRCQSQWPVPQMRNPPLELFRPATFMGAAYAASARLAGGQDAYTLRSRRYAQLFHTFHGGHDPRGEIAWDQSLTFHLALVHFDNCFITLCPDRAVVPIDPPTSDASCVSGPDEALSPADAFGPSRPDPQVLLQAALQAESARQALAQPGVTPRVSQRIAGGGTVAADLLRADLMAWCFFGAFLGVLLGLAVMWRGGKVARRVSPWKPLRDGR